MISSFYCVSCFNYQPTGFINRSFTVDIRTQNFIKDGQPFRYVSGGMHYFRIPHEYWRDRLQKLRAMGANAVETYVEWSLHEPQPNTFNFRDEADLIKYIQLAQEEDLLVILRPGPYICAERYMGGLPYWLLSINPNMQIRTSDTSFMMYTERWMTRLLTMIRPYLYSQGGPIILVQIENEYGSYSACDSMYMSQLKSIFDNALGIDQVVYFTTDGPSSSLLQCGQTARAVTTVDFGHTSNITECFSVQRKFDSGAPFVNSEYYTGWLDHWSENHQQVDSLDIANSLDRMLSFASNVNVNLYMFHGGTSFGFSNGANWGNNKYQPDPTSYDYDAPCNEAGDLTDKYFALKHVITSHLGHSNTYIATSTSRKLFMSHVYLTQHVGSLFDLIGLFDQDEIITIKPLIYELLDQPNGFVIYSHIVDIELSTDTLSTLQVAGLHDRAIVYINFVKVGILSRMINKFSLLIQVTKNDRISILVEDLGRIGYGDKNDEYKGITGRVKLNGVELKNWIHQKIPLHRSQVIDAISRAPGMPIDSTVDTNLPRFYRGQFILKESPKDTFINLPDWTKGMIWINGFNLGRYWPQVGPQVTLYLPGCKLLPPPMVNTIVIFELESSPCNSPQTCFVQFLDQHILNGTVRPDPAFDLWTVDDTPTMS